MNDCANSRCGRIGWIAGLPVNLDPKQTVFDEIDELIRKQDNGHYISITNTESMYHGLRIPEHGDYIRNADFSLCDGVGVIVVGWFWGLRVSRLNGPVLQLECSRIGVEKGWRHFFYGGKRGVAREMARRLQRLYPGLTVCGIYEPPFRDPTPEEDAEVVTLINESRPDLVWVGLGLLKQEKWIAAHLGRIKAPWMIGVGASFDYHAGTVPWAPAIIRRAGFEWLFRLIIQPRLRAKRYWWSAVYVVQNTIKGLFGGQFIRISKSNGLLTWLVGCNFRR